jgi:hypothetical protein
MVYAVRAENPGGLTDFFEAESENFLGDVAVATEPAPRGVPVARRMVAYPGVDR